MHTDVFNLVDILIDMAGSSLNTDDVNAELNTIRRMIEETKNRIEDLKSIMIDARYFNASNELVDKNIEISLKNKINRLERNLKSLHNTIDDINNNETITHQKIKELKSKIDKNEEYINILKKKNTNSKNVYFENLLKNEEKNIENLRANLEEKKKEHDSILKELEVNTRASIEIKEQLEYEGLRLNDIEDNLRNPNAYLDEALRVSDEEKMASLNKDLEKYEKRELELLTDAGLIGLNAKELIANSNIEEALLKIKELVTVVKSKPYMDVSNFDLLSEELEKKESERVELSNLIDSKNYEGINSDSVKNRIEYCHNEINYNNDEVMKLEKIISSIDDFITNELGGHIASLESEILENEKTLKDYRDKFKEKGISNKARANLEQAISKKEKENQILDDILISYKDDLCAKILKTNELNEEINSLKKSNEHYKQELVEIEKVTFINFKTRDLVEETKDKEALKKLNEEIKSIKSRQKYDKTPNEIYDQIEMMLDVPRSKKEEKVKEVEVVDNLNIEDINDHIIPQDYLKVVQMIPVETKKKPTGGTE